MKNFRTLFLVMVLVIMSFSTVFAEQHLTWEGIRIRGNEQFNSANLDITNLTEDRFNFKIQAFNGVNTGGLSGIAYINNNYATFNDGKGGILDFVLNQDGTIIITQSDKMFEYGGIGVDFYGSYIFKHKQRTAVVNNHFTKNKVFKGNQEEEFQRLVGDNYLKFKNTAQMFYYEKDLDNINARVYRISIRGLGAIMESIIMIRDSDNAIWAAVIDNNIVLYFTNTTDTEYVPLTISRWHDRLKDKPIYYIPTN